MAPWNQADVHALLIARARHATMKDSTPLNNKPALSFWQIWNMCFGFLGLQFGFALQNANVSRIFQTLGANVNEIPVLWIAAPLTGLIVQPIIGHFSDRTWNRLGRRRPYFLVGAVFASLALLWMPNAPALWMAAGLLWILDASINVSMEPFRAFVGDQLPTQQRPLRLRDAELLHRRRRGGGLGAAVGAGAVRRGQRGRDRRHSRHGEVRVLHRRRGAAGRGAVDDPAHARVSACASCNRSPTTCSRSRRRMPRAPGEWAWLLLVVGALVLFAIGHFALEKELYLLAGGLIVFGLLFVWLSFARSHGMLREVMADLYGMPTSMRRLAWVQFFSWFALFAMWIYTTSGVTADASTAPPTPARLAYNEGANWVGVLFAAYNGFAALAAVVIPLMVRRWGLRISHLVNLCLGGAGLLSFLLIRDPQWLLASMVGVGFAWASILSLPYALLSDNLPAAKMGVYMGIFNFFIVIPQLLAASVLGLLLRLCFHNQPIWALALGGACLLVAGLFTLRVHEPQTHAVASTLGLWERLQSRCSKPAIRKASRLKSLPQHPDFAAAGRPHALQKHAPGLRDGPGRRRSPKPPRRHARVRRHRRAVRIQRDLLRDDRPLRQRRSVQRPAPPGRRASHLRHSRCPAHRKARAPTSATSAATSRACWTTPATSAAWASARCGSPRSCDNPNEAFTGGDPVSWGSKFTDRGKTGFHGYWGVNFYKLDEHLPSKGLDFAQFTAKMHAQGLKDGARHRRQPRLARLHDAEARSRCSARFSTRPAS